jgi:Holliday junction resolvase-like predicted endonuclease
MEFMIGQELPNQARYFEGKAAEERVAAMLMDMGFSLEDTSGTNGEPDLIAVKEGRKAAIEVKSIWPFSKSKKSGIRGTQISGIRIEIWELEALKEWAEKNGALDVWIITEIRIPHSSHGPVYLWARAQDLPGPVASLKWIYVSLYDLLGVAFFTDRPGRRR